MPRLNNPTDFDVFAPQIHRTIPRMDSIEIEDSEVALFDHNSILRVADGEVLTEPEEDEEETAAPTRRTVTRGSKRAEVTTAPKMETR